MLVVGVWMLTPSSLLGRQSTLLLIEAMSNYAQPPNTNKPLIIFCHGSGDTGAGVQAWIESLVTPSVYHQWDWIFPTAKPIPYQLNGGMVTSVWYDRVGGFDPEFPEQIETIEKSTDRLLALLDNQILKEGRDPRRIIIGGFSMGGAIAYQTAARWHARPDAVPMGGVFGLSCYLNDDSKVWSMLANHSSWPPTYMAHGAVDDFILPKWGKATYDRFVTLDVPASFRLIPNTHHEMTPKEIEELLEFLDGHIGDHATTSGHERHSHKSHPDL
jgi:phospholipase/carboxylesterase